MKLVLMYVPLRTHSHRHTLSYINQFKMAFGIDFSRCVHLSNCWLSACHQQMGDNLRHILMKFQHWHIFSKVDSYSKWIAFEHFCNASPYITIFWKTRYAKAGKKIMFGRYRIFYTHQHNRKKRKKTKFSILYNTGPDWFFLFCQ